MKLVTGDVVLFVRDICNTFLQLMGQHKSLTFYSSVDEQMMSFDAEKLRRIMEICFRMPINTRLMGAGLTSPYVS